MAVGDALPEPSDEPDGGAVVTARVDGALAHVKSALIRLCGTGRRDHLELLQRDALPPLAAIPEGAVGGGEAGLPAERRDREFMGQAISSQQQEKFGEEPRAARAETPRLSPSARHDRARAARPRTTARRAPFDPRHQRDARCEPAVKFDAAGKQRDLPSTSTYLCVALAASATRIRIAQARAAATGAARPSRSIAPVPRCPFCASTCSSSSPCCAFKDDIGALVAAPGGVVSGVRAKLPARARAAVPRVVGRARDAERELVHWRQRRRIPGDHLGRRRRAFTGAGDNHQVGVPASPLSFFRVVGGPTEMGCDHPATHHDQPSPTCKNVTMTGDAVVITSQSPNKCPSWGSGVPNVKSSGVISLRGVLYWAVSCFNYGDDAVFNRQRYGPAWLITSADGGKTWNTSATPPDFFTGRLAAPRFVQHGRDNAGAPDSWVYVYFPGTSGGDAFFENNDLVLLGRASAPRVLERDAYQFYMGTGLDGGVRWTSNATIARPIFEHPLMTSVQQANYIPRSGRYVFANWAWMRTTATRGPTTPATATAGRATSARSSRCSRRDAVRPLLRLLPRRRLERRRRLQGRVHAGDPAGVGGREGVLARVHAVLRQPAAAAEQLQLHRAGCRSRRCPVRRGVVTDK